MHLLKVAFNNIQISRIMSFYAVAVGRRIGIYTNWPSCEEQIKCFKGAKYKKFPTRSEADAYLKQHTSVNTKHQYKPEDHTVPLGAKAKENKNQYIPEDHTATLGAKAKEKQVEVVNKESEDLWPQSNGDDFITDEDLLMALAEVEGLPPQTSQNRKRKADSHIKSTSSNKIPKHESIIWEPVGLKHIGNMEFLLDSEGYVIVYTDGSCFNNGQKNACAGYGVYFGDNHVLNVGKPVVGRVTNNVGEIQAAIYAIKTAKRMGITKLCLCTDSQFLINSITLWIKGWKAKNWRLRNGEPVKNVADFKELDALLQDKSVEIKWVNFYACIYQLIFL
ncbi:hypothetical protein DOY81_012960 [Sarcophaga bullata]|nr:hypothetical protein DOY81_012960 [Sarcophaga bullata]